MREFEQLPRFDRCTNLASIAAELCAVVAVLMSRISLYPKNVRVLFIYFTASTQKMFMNAHVAHVMNLSNTAKEHRAALRILKKRDAFFHAVPL